MAMNAERWQEISRLYHAALTRTPDERAAFFEKECPDHLLRCEIESLLLHNTATGLLPAALTGELTGPLGPTAATSLIGRHIGPYHVLLRLGVGGMGEVYRARDSSWGETWRSRSCRTPSSRIRIGWHASSERRDCSPR